jgi:hypothetical protein
MQHLLIGLGPLGTEHRHSNTNVSLHLLEQYSTGVLLELAIPVVDGCIMYSYSCGVSSCYVVILAELSKLYGLHVHVIVFQTSDCCTWEPDNSGSLSGVLGEPRIIHVYISEQDTLQKALQYYNSYTNIQIYFIRVNSGSLTNHKFTNHLFSCYKP